VPFLRTYDVYNLYQVRGCNYLRRKKRGFVDFAPADDLVKSSRAIVRTATIACYDIVNDVIFCPHKDNFVSRIGYYTTILHELAHWTGGKSRLKRIFGINKETTAYAFEELVAELTSCFLAANLEIPEALEQMPQHASYVKTWLALLQDDTRAIFKAASAAQRATKYLLEGQSCRRAS